MTNTANRYHNRQVWAQQPRPSDYIPWPSDLDAPEVDTWTDFDLPRSAARTRTAPAPHRPTWAAPTLPVPILALDVDGPLNAFRMSEKARRRKGFRDVAFRSAVTYRPGSTWVPHPRLHLHRAHGELLAEFSRVHDVELVWCSLWEHNGNTVIGPALGLPRLPWVDFHGHPVRGQWKFPAVAEFAAGRPLAWLDDAFSAPRKVAQRASSGFDRARRGLPTLLHEVDPARGIVASDLDAVASWLCTARLAW